jgi:hypothetical protein
MPRATRTEDTQRFDLKSCPPDGFVLLRQLSYDEVLERRDLAMHFEASDTTRGRRIASTLQAKMSQREVSTFEFRHCIIDHNLEDATGRKLDFTNSSDIANLDPRVGQEIERYIRDLTQPPDEEETNAFRPDGVSTDSEREGSPTDGDGGR